MFDLDRWQEIWVTLTRNKTRSVMTGFVIFWGIFILVVMAGSGKALENGIMEGIKGFSTNSCFFWTNSTSEPFKGFRKGRFWNMKNSDIEIIRSKIPQIKYITPMVFGGNSPNNTVYKDKAGAYFVKGFYPVYDKIDHQQLLYGRFINEIDIREKRKVAVIGRKIYEDLFQKGISPIGEMLKVNGMYFTVVGVINPITVININGPMAESVILPETTMQQAYNYGEDVHLLAITAQDNYKISEIEEQIKNELKKQHNIAPNDAQAVNSVNLEKQFTMFSYLFLGIYFLTWVVASGTLFSGVLGVSNIMMVTVKERTKEIGIRRAIGAKPRTIITQVMSETLLLTLFAGILGLCVGVGILVLVDLFSYIIIVWIFLFVVLIIALYLFGNFIIKQIKSIKSEMDILHMLNVFRIPINTTLFYQLIKLISLITIFLVSITYSVIRVVSYIITASKVDSEEHVFFSHPQISFQMAIWALIILLISGLIAGFIPAWRALQIKAIDAIREE
ncbi:MAG: ABC transporter permease [Bacteroidales bacterium]|nr:ABC transporter permease [Bacteroidales bacterium]